MVQVVESWCRCVSRAPVKGLDCEVAAQLQISYLTRHPRPILRSSAKRNERGSEMLVNYRREVPQS
jgi:hypothetical protein